MAVASPPPKVAGWAAKVCGRSGAGRAGTGPARPPPPHRSGPACGRPASGLVAGRLGAGGRSPPAGALCRGGGGPVAGCGRLGVGLAALPAPVPRLRLIRPPPAGPPPSGPAAGWGRPPVWGPPVVLFGLVPAAARGAKGPPAPHPSQRPGEAARCRPGDGGLVSCRLRAAPPCGLRPAAPP